MRIGSDNAYCMAILENGTRSRTDRHRPKEIEKIQPFPNKCHVAISELDKLKIKEDSFFSFFFFCASYLVYKFSCFHHKRLPVPPFLSSVSAFLSSPILLNHRKSSLNTRSSADSTKLHFAMATIISPKSSERKSPDGKNFTAVN